MTTPGSSPDGREEQGGMPMPASFGTSAQPADAGGMPRPSMGDAGTSGGMPRPGAAGDHAPNIAAGPESMPVPDDAASLMTEELPRFGPPGGAGGGAAHEPGVVEVQFRSGVLPSLATVGAGAPSIAADGGALDQMNQILQRHGVVQAEPTFDISVEDATAAQTVAVEQGIDAPHLAQFMTLHFAPDADTPAIAEELSGLPEVEKAIAVPVALPPTAVVPGTGTPSAPAPRAAMGTETAPAPVAAPPAGPLSEPLVGTSSQVVLNPTTGLENQWYVYRCRVDQAWARSSGRNVVVADVDWGYRTSHEDLAAKIRRTHNSFDGTSDVTHGGSVSHGTAVTGLAGGGINGRGMAGVAYDAEVWGIQADSGTSASLGGNAWARGIDWVRTQNSNGRRKVIILEVQTGAFGNYEQVPSVNAAIRTAIAAGVVVCVAAGNGDKDAGLDDSGTRSRRPARSSSGRRRTTRRRTSAPGSATGGRGSPSPARGTPPTT